MISSSLLGRAVLDFDPDRDGLPSKTEEGLTALGQGQAPLDILTGSSDWGMFDNNPADLASVQANSMSATTLGSVMFAQTSPSPTMADEVAFISGVSSNGIQPLDAFSGWNGDTPASYTGGFTDAAKWGANTAGTTGGTIDYYFDPNSHWTATEETALAAGLALWSDVANISFVATTNASSAQITFTRGTDGGAETGPSYVGDANSGKTGTSDLLTLTSAKVSIDTSVPGFGPINGNFTTDGGYPTMTLLHEEGHAIGLGHAGPYDGDDNPATQQFSAYDTRLWSIMSYIEPQDSTAEYSSQYTVTGTQWSNNDPTGLMPLDILAAEALYGLPTSTPLSGGQTFGFNCNVTGASEAFFDFTKNTAPILTLWDEGTGNTLDLSGFAAAETVNLNGGAFSSVDGLTNNLAIATGTVINSFIGGSGADTILANSGSDVIDGGPGPNAGGAPNSVTVDRSSYGGNLSGVFTSSSTTAQIISDGTAFGLSLKNIQGLNLTSGSGNDQMTFSETVSNAPDSWNGGAGNDTATIIFTNSINYTGKIVNGAYDIFDQNHTNAVGVFTNIEIFNITTGSGNDVLATSSGNDTFNGGAGTDTVIYTGTEANYTFQNLGGGIIQVVDTRPGSPDGTDTIQNIEQLTFSNGTFAVSSLPLISNNVAPVLGGGGATISYGVHGAAVVADAGLTVSDADSPNLASATVTISSGFETGDVLALANQNGITGAYDPASHILTLSGSASVAAYQAALETVTFSSTSDNPTNFDASLSRTLSWTVDDGAVSNHLSNGVTTSVALASETITGDASANTLNGGPYSDVIMGLAGDDILNGGSGDDLLIGGAGNDTMSGGPGNDTYEVTEAGDQVIEGAGQGTDSVYSYINGYTLPDNVEILLMEGNDHYGIGNGLDNSIYGTAGDDIIIGGAGNDLMVGGTGNDTYEVTEAGDQVVENPSAGTDTVYAYVNGYALPDNVEILIMEGNDHYGIGNSGDNSIYGTAGDDIIIGGAGNDLMVGGTGNDTYEVTEAGDQVVENPNAGTDTIYAYVNGYTLPANVEILIMEGADHFGIGNSGDNTIYGTPGDDIIIGGAGNDLMVGGAGNDTYEVTEAGDQVVETPNAGTDTLYAYVNGYALPDNVEILIMEGNDHFGIGNALDNTIYGTPSGDVISGGLGNDTLFGGAGSDNFLFTKGDGNDTIMDFTPTAGGDIISLHGYGVAAYAALTPLMSQVGSDVVITFDANNHLTLHGLLLNQLNSGDFTFG